MTRDEAIKAYADAAHDSRLEYYDETRRKAEVMIRCLEAIGLIKFDEPNIKDALIRLVSDRLVGELTKIIDAVGLKLVEK